MLASARLRDGTWHRRPGPSPSSASVGSLVCVWSVPSLCHPDKPKCRYPISSSSASRSELRDSDRSLYATSPVRRGLVVERITIKNRASRQDSYQVRDPRPSGTSTRAAPQTPSVAASSGSCPTAPVRRGLVVTFFRNFHGTPDTATEQTRPHTYPLSTPLPGMTRHGRVLRPL